MNRRTEAASILTLLSLLLSGCCQIGQPCAAHDEMLVGVTVGAVVGAAVGTSFAVNHEHHVLKGCVSSGPDGLQLTKDSDKKNYSLVGTTAGIKPGEKIKLHGTKQRKPKGSTGNQQFLVDRVTKDLGPCESAATSTTTPSSATCR